MFHEPGTFRTGWALIAVGEPVETADCVALARSEPEEAARAPHRPARRGDARASSPRWTTARRSGWSSTRSASGARSGTRSAPRDAAARADWRRRATRAYRYLIHHDPAGLGASGAWWSATSRTWRPPRSAPRSGSRRRARAWCSATRSASSRSCWAACRSRSGGSASHAVPYWLTWAAVKPLRPEPDVEATYKLVAGIVLFPLAWIAEGWLALALAAAAGCSRSSSSC